MLRKFTFLCILVGPLSRWFSGVNELVEVLEQVGSLKHLHVQQRKLELLMHVKVHFVIRAFSLVLQLLNYGDRMVQVLDVWREATIGVSKIVPNAIESHTQFLAYRHELSHFLLLPVPLVFFFARVLVEAHSDLLHGRTCVPLRLQFHVDFAVG